MEKIEKSWPFGLSGREDVGMLDKKPRGPHSGGQYDLSQEYRATAKDRGKIKELFRGRRSYSKPKDKKKGNRLHTDRIAVIMTQREIVKKGRYTGKWRIRDLYRTLGKDRKGGEGGVGGRCKVLSRKGALFTERLFEKGGWYFWVGGRRGSWVVSGVIGISETGISSGRGKMRGGVAPGSARDERGFVKYHWRGPGRYASTSGGWGGLCHLVSYGYHAA